MSSLIIVIQAIFSLICLIIGSFFDWRDREVPNKLWLFQILGGFGLLILYFIIDDPHTLFVLGNVFIGSFIGITMFAIGAWGGADSKAIIALSVSSPSVGILLIDTSNYLYDHFPPILFILFNFLIVLLLFAFSLIIGGIISSFKYALFEQPNLTLSDKFALLMSCIKVDQASIEAVTNVDFVEQFDEETNEWIIKLSLFMPEEEEELDLTIRREEFSKLRKEIFEKAVETDKKSLWVRLQPPGILFMLIGYLMWITIGSPLATLLLWIGP
ncbi:MAG: prepilin peptidase [Candidatus Heimdallarchaeota archaeon]|nr:prepilin peptidase [Candidatus Heimdallarchaeota archaeon]MCK5049262.1 prepilin peptidase [Candidatus Heimdallarchaeota archaeon]